MKKIENKFSIYTIAATLLFATAWSQGVAQEQPQPPSQQEPSQQQVPPPTRPEPTQQQPPQPHVPQQDSLSLRTDFSPNELESFVKANEKVTEVQKETEEKIIQKIEEEGLTVERFNQILESRRNPDSEEEVTPEELQSFNQAAQMIVTENQSIQGKISDVIEEEGIDLDTYQQIIVAYQQSPEVKQKVDQLMGDRDSQP